MGRIITIIMIIAVGAGYFLYQRYLQGNVRHIMAELRGETDPPGGWAYQRRVTGAAGQAPRPAAPPVNRTPPPRPLVPASMDGITETGPMVYFANDRHGRSDREYRFNFKKVGGCWRAYILRMPSLGNRSAGSHTIHRLQDSGGYYICWDRTVSTLKDMQNISRRWADSVQEYISTGRFGV